MRQCDICNGKILKVNSEEFNVTDEQKSGLIDELTDIIFREGDPLKIVSTCKQAINNYRILQNEEPIG